MPEGMVDVAACSVAGESMSVFVAKLICVLVLWVLALMFVANLGMGVKRSTGPSMDFLVEGWLDQLKKKNPKEDE